MQVTVVALKGHEENNIPSEYLIIVDFNLITSLTIRFIHISL